MSNIPARPPEKVVTAIPHEYDQRARRMAARSHRRFSWIPFDEWYQEMLIATWSAMTTHDPETGVPEGAWVSRKMVYAAMEHLRASQILTKAEYEFFGNEFAFIPILDGRTMDEEFGVQVGTIDTGFAQLEAAHSVARILPELRERDRDVLVKRYLDGRTQMDIALNDYGVTESRVCQIETLALKRARQIAERTGPAESKPVPKRKSRMYKKPTVLAPKPPKLVPCEQCPQIVDASSGRKYCSDRCRVRAHRRRKAS